jgi:hypothetical protein
MIWLSFCTSRDAGRQGFAFLEDFLLRTCSEDLGELNAVDGCRTRVERPLQIRVAGIGEDGSVGADLFRRECLGISSSCSLRGVAFDRQALKWRAPLQILLILESSNSKSIT